MAILTVFNLPTMNAEKYDRVVRDLEAAGEGKPKGRLYHIASRQEDGSFVITRHEGTGGRITVASIKEQLLYEMGDPRAYITPDCVADFTTIQLEQAGADRAQDTHPKRPRN